MYVPFTISSSFFLKLQAQQQEKIKSNLKGVALGDAWISPIDSVMTWAPFLLATVRYTFFNVISYIFSFYIIYTLSIFYINWQNIFVGYGRH